MPMLTVQLSAEDIDSGVRRNNWLCPVCRALFRITGVKWVVEETTCYPLTHRDVFIPLPPEAITFIATFDATGIAEPIEFQLEIPGDESGSEYIGDPL